MPRDSLDNFFQLPPPAADETFEPLWQRPGLRVERIISRGQTTPPGVWYDQAGDEWVLLLQGQAQLTYADGTCQELQAGDYLLIPAGCRHRVTYTSSEPPCLWLAIHAS